MSLKKITDSFYFDVSREIYISYILLFDPNNHNAIIDDVWAVNAGDMLSRVAKLLTFATHWEVDYVSVYLSKLDGQLWFLKDLNCMQIIASTLGIDYFAVEFGFTTQSFWNKFGFSYKRAKYNFKFKQKYNIRTALALILLSLLMTVCV